MRSGLKHFIFLALLAVIFTIGLTFASIELPRFVAGAFNLPLRLMFKKPYPERKREIVAVLAFYTVLCLGISAFLNWSKNDECCRN